MTTNSNEKRIAKVARQAARLVMGLRDEGHEAAADRLEAAATEACQRMREGR